MCGKCRHPQSWRGGGLVNFCPSCAGCVSSALLCCDLLGKLSLCHCTRLRISSEPIVGVASFTPSPCHWMHLSAGWGQWVIGLEFQSALVLEIRSNLSVGHITDGCKTCWKGHDKGRSFTDQEVRFTRTLNTT